MAKGTPRESAKKPASRKTGARKAAAKPAEPRAAAHRASKAAKTRPPRLLSGGNPQIAKGDGDAPVRAYIGAMPGWKRDVGRRLDALIERTVPGVGKAVRWNSPFYGTPESGWFLSFHCITKYVKVAFFGGASLRPMPPVASKNKGVRYLHIHEGDWTDGGGPLDERQLADWIRQASKVPGWPGFNC